MSAQYRPASHPYTGESEVMPHTPEQWANFVVMGHFNKPVPPDAALFEGFHRLITEAILQYHKERLEEITAEQA